jgi:hypothetical protein
MSHTDAELKAMLERAEDLSEVCPICDGHGFLDCEEGEPFCSNECMDHDACRQPCPYCADLPAVVKELLEARAIIQALGECRTNKPCFDCADVTCPAAGERTRAFLGDE